VIVIGIDPGTTGAIAVLDRGNLVYVGDMPMYDGRTDGAALADLLDEWQANVAYLEQTQAMPKNGTIASHSLGMNSGIVIGVLQSMRHPFVRVRPAVWKSKMSVTHKDKNAIRGIVRELYPAWSSSFARVKDHNRAEAVLIGRYGVAQQLQEANQ
jgi:crossover junction endodeoxyribonuclease RuvC